MMRLMAIRSQRLSSMFPSSWLPSSSSLLPQTSFSTLKPCVYYSRFDALTTSTPSASSLIQSRALFSEDRSALEELDLAQMKGIKRNLGIREQTVRVIDPTGTPIGTIPTSDAIEMAKRAGMDLVEITPVSSTEHAICQIMSYKMFQEYKNSLNKKRSAEKVKEVVVMSEIMENDLQMKIRQVDKFLSEGLLVDLKLNIKGRYQKLKQGNDTVLLGTQLLTAILKRVETEVVLVGLIQANEGNASVRIRAAQVDSKTKEQSKENRRRKFLQELSLSEERIKELREKQKREQQEEEEEVDQPPPKPVDYADTLQKKYGGMNTRTPFPLVGPPKAPLKDVKINIQEPPKKKATPSTATTPRDENDPDNNKDILRVRKPTKAK